MKVLVTGGAGYVGGILVPQLLRENYSVTVIDDFRYRRPCLLECCNDERLTIVRGDCRNRNVVERHVAGADVILPLAALVGAPICDRDPIGAQTINFDAVKMLLDMSSKQQRVIFPCTNSGYGIGDEGSFCTEKSPLRPLSLYGRLKVQMEEIVLQRGNSISLRLATVFGISPAMRLDLLVNDFTYRAYKDKFVVLFESHFKRNFIHVRDVARAFVHCLKNFEKMAGEPYNVGLSEANISKRELCEAIRRHVPEFQILESEIGKDVDKRNYVVSNEKIESTGYRPQVSLDAGIRELLRGFPVLDSGTFGNV